MTSSREVYAQLAAMDQAGKDYAGNPDFQIFKGTKLRCKKAVLGFRNCCKDSGWGCPSGSPIATSRKSS